MTTDNELLTFDEFCSELGIGTVLGYRLLKSGTVKAFHLGRSWRIPRSSITEMISQQTLKYHSELSQKK